MEIVNTDRVTMAPTPTARDVEQEQRTVEHLRASQENNLQEPARLVDKLEYHRVDRDGKLRFLLRCSGPYQPTWEPNANIPEDLVSRYLQRVRCTDPARATKEVTQGDGKAQR